MHRHLIKLAIAAAGVTFVTAALAASADDYKAAAAKAEAAIKEAHALRNEWTTTTDEMKAAAKAVEAGKFDEAVKHAQEAEALAKASAAQARDEVKLWPEAVIR